MSITQSRIPFHHHVCGPFILYRFLSPTLSSGHHHTVICAHEFLSACLSCSFIYCFQFYIPHVNEIVWLLTISVWLILLHKIFSRSIHVVTGSNISSFLWLSRIPLCHGTCLYAIIYGTLQSFHGLAIVKNATVSIRVHITLQIDVFKFFRRKLYFSWHLTLTTKVLELDLS